MLACVKAALCQRSLDSRTWLWPSAVRISPQLLKNVISQPFYFLGCLDRSTFLSSVIAKAINKCWSSIIHTNIYVVNKSIGFVLLFSPLKCILLSFGYHILFFFYHLRSLRIGTHHPWSKMTVDLCVAAIWAKRRCREVHWRVEHTEKKRTIKKCSNNK